ncbi:hypothetical protein JCM6882_000027 [Rhodosporidiobolus microsporus]
MKRLIVGVDGTWQTALHQTHPANLSNITRLVTALETVDQRGKTPIAQLKLYIPGVGTGEEVATGAYHGALGEGVLEKVREAYYWLAQNWDEGDEIFLFGFSRGSYIVRLLTTTIHLLGILDRKSTLSLFPKIFDVLCSNWNPHKGGGAGATELEPLLEAIKPAKVKQLEKAEGGFLIRVGLFDTVPLYHLRRLDPLNPSTHISPLGLPDAPLEPHIQTALHALAINEGRDAYEPLLWEVGPEGLREGQELEQTWFAGVHTDIGGGNSIHDLSDLSLAWMVSRLIPHLAFDISYLAALSAHPSAPWGSMKPRIRSHLLRSHPRLLPFPPSPNSSPPRNNQHFHPSILAQDPLNLPPSLHPLLHDPTNPLFVELGDWEKDLKAKWAVKAVQLLSGVSETEAENDTTPASPPPSPSSGAPPPASLPLHKVVAALSAFVPTARDRGDPLPAPAPARKKEMRALVQDWRDAEAKIEGAGDSHRQRRGR